MGELLRETAISYHRLSCAILNSHAYASPLSNNAYVICKTYQRGNPVKNEHVHGIECKGFKTRMSGQS